MTMEDPVKAMKFEWRQNGTAKDWANFRYVLEGRARDPEFVKSGSRSMSRRAFRRETAKIIFRIVSSLDFT